MRYLNPVIYENAQFLELSCCAQTVAIFLLYGPNMKQLPIFELAERTVRTKFDISSDDWGQVKAELVSFGITYESGFWVLDNRFTDFLASKGPTNDGPIAKAIAQLPESLRQRLLQIEGIEEKLGGRDVAAYVSGSASMRPTRHESPLDRAISEVSETTDSPIKPYASLEYLDELSDEEATEYATHYGLEQAQVILEAHRAADYYRAKGKRAKDYRAVLRNWLTSPYQENGKTPAVIDIGEPLAIEPAPKEWL